MEIMCYVYGYILMVGLVICLIFIMAISKYI